MLQRMLNRLRGVNDDEKGFTLIELLVVILIIGILAAIALPTFLGQSDKAKDASAKSNARNAVSQMESCIVDADVGTCITNKADGQLAQFKDTTVTAPASGVAGGLYTINATSKTTGVYSITKGEPGFVYTSSGKASGATAWAANSGTAAPAAP